MMLGDDLQAVIIRQIGGDEWIRWMKGSEIKPVRARMGRRTADYRNLDLFYLSFSRMTIKSFPTG